MNEWIVEEVDKTTNKKIYEQTFTSYEEANGVYEMKKNSSENFVSIYKPQRKLLVE